MEREEELTFNNIMDEGDLFSPSIEEKPSDEPVDGNKDSDDKTTDKKKEKSVESVPTPEGELFEHSESVDSNKEKEVPQEGKDTDVSEKDDGKTPAFFSSIASALKDEGVLSNLEDADINNVKTPEDFTELMRKQVQSQLDDVQKRVSEALENGVKPNVVSEYESAMKYLDSIKEDALSAETKEAEKLRRDLIYQDCVNRGFTAARAQKEVDKSINAGSDVDDAKDALESTKDFYSKQYDEIRKSAKEESEKKIKETKEQQRKLEDAVLKTESPFGVQMTEQERHKVYDSISKPVFKDESGNYYTAVQKYAKDNPLDFMHKMGVLYYLTDGFQNLEKLVGKEVKKNTKESMKELESKLHGSIPFSDGSPKLVGYDKGTKQEKGFRLDI